jgi:GNAT superfamily N-acetyltransferase
MRATEYAELTAMADLFAVAPPELGAQLARSGEAIAIRVAALPQVVEVNRILGLSSTGELDELEGVYGNDRVVVSLDPQAALDEELAARGYTPGYPWHKFERGLEPLEARTELSIEDARSPRDFGLTVAGGFGLPEQTAGWLGLAVGRPGWHCFVGYDGAEPVTAGALFAAEESGWFGLGATLPAARGRGGQSGLFAARIARARELGLKTLVTETGAPRDGAPGPSYRNMLRAGFEVVYERPNYVRQAEAPE